MPTIDINFHDVCFKGCNQQSTQTVVVQFADATNPHGYGGLSMFFEDQERAEAVLNAALEAVRTMKRQEPARTIDDVPPVVLPPPEVPGAEKGTLANPFTEDDTPF